MFFRCAAARRLRQRVPEHRRCLDSVQRTAAEPREREGMRLSQETDFLRVFPLITAVVAYKKQLPSLRELNSFREAVHFRTHKLSVWKQLSYSSSSSEQLKRKSPTV